MVRTGGETYGSCNGTIAEASGGENRPHLANLRADMLPSPHEHNTASNDVPGDAPAATTEPPAPVNSPQSEPRPALPREIGGRDGPEPTRFGDWEKAGRCIDF